jgi:quercetin dioxygenase-like cupin family protein
MRTLVQSLAIGGAFLAAAALAAPVAAMEGHHRMVLPDEVEWGPAPPSVPEGVQFAVLYGNPGEAGLFAFRLKFPEGFVVPPHFHSVPEVLTVISGTFILGMGEEADRDAATPLPAGSIVSYPAGEPHYAFVDEETVVQINAVGPFDITYVNPEDDPRLQN